MLTPDHIAAARCIVSDPERFAHIPALRSGAFLTLKEAQGHPVTAERRTRLFGAEPEPAPGNPVDAARVKSIGTIRAAVARRLSRAPTGGDAA